MRRIILKHTEFIRNVGVLMSGKVIAGMIALLTVPIVARFFEPGDFGVAAMFVSSVTIVSVIASLNYGAALVLPKAESQALQLMGLAYRIVVIYSFALFVLIGAYAVSGLSWSMVDSLGMWIWLLPVGACFVGSLQIQSSWQTREKAFRTMAASQVAENASVGGLRILAGALWGTSVFALIWSFIAAKIARFIVNRSAVRAGIRAALVRNQGPAMRKLAREYADFPKFNAPASLVFELAQSLPVLLFGALFSAEIAGFYAMANRLTRVPLSVVSNSMRTVLLQKSAEIVNRGRDLRRAFVLSLGAMAAIGAGPLVVLWFFGQPLAVWLLGDQWFTAGAYLEIMAPWLYGIWVAIPCNSAFVTLRKQRVWLAHVSIFTVLRLGTIGIAYFLSADAARTLGAFVVASVFANCAVVVTAGILVFRHAAESGVAASDSRM